MCFQQHALHILYDFSMMAVVWTGQEKEKDPESSDAAST